MIGGSAGVLRWDGHRWNALIAPDEITEVGALAYRGSEVIVLGRTKSGPGVRVIGAEPSDWEYLPIDHPRLDNMGPRVLATAPDGSLWVGVTSAGIVRKGDIWFHR